MNNEINTNFDAPGSVVDLSLLSQEEILELEKLCRRRKRRQIVQIGRAALRGEPVREADVWQMIMSLSKSRRISWREKAVSCMLLGVTNLTASQQAEVAQELIHVLTNRDIVKRGILAVLSIILYQPIFIPLMIINERHRNQARSAAARSMGRLRLIGGVGALAGGLFEKTSPGSKGVARSCEQTLPVLLAELTPSHYGLLSAVATGNLCKAIGHSNEALVLAALNALEKVGGGSTVDAVTAVANGHPSHEVRDRAQSILPVLLARQRKENEGRVLLRASDAADSPEQTLLRAAQGNTESDPAVLLRSSSSGGNS
jgi:hypothetical protein